MCNQYAALQQKFILFVTSLYRTKDLKIVLAKENVNLIKSWIQFLQYWFILDKSIMKKASAALISSFRSDTRNSGGISKQESPVDTYL